MSLSPVSSGVNSTRAALPELSVGDSGSLLERDVRTVSVIAFRRLLCSQTVFFVNPTG
ncbi:MAG: hypothetical protein RLP44_21145 [Aggregatilineales bacterium]